MKKLKNILGFSVYIPLIFPIALYSYYLRIYIILGHIPEIKNKDEFNITMNLHSLLVFNSFTFTFLIVFINILLIIICIIKLKNRPDNSILIGFTISTLIWAIVVIFDPFGIFSWIVG